MPTYITLMNWTDQGIREFKDTATRARSVTDAAARMGGTIRDAFWTVGPYDLVGIAEFADDETAAAFLLWLGSLGTARTTTMRAFNADEISAIISKAR